MEYGERKQLPASSKTSQIEVDSPWTTWSALQTLRNRAITFYQISLKVSAKGDQKRAP